MPTRMPTDRASPAPLSSGVLQAITRHSTQSHPIISYPACQQRKYAPLQKKKKAHCQQLSGLSESVQRESVAPNKPPGALPGVR